MKTRIILTTAAILGLALTVAPSVHAQATRTWVSGFGDDANPGSRTAPCKTFAGAISKTTPGGEISVLDPGGFGAVTITKAITLDGDGTLASILVSGTNAIIVNAGLNDVVIIRNLSFQGMGTGLNCIQFLAGKQLIVENCNINSFTGSGVNMALTTAGTAVVKHTTITSCNVGVYLNTPAGVNNATVDGATITKCNTGVYAPAGTAQVVNSTITQCNTYGLCANGGTISCSDSLLSFDNTAVYSLSNSTIRLSNDNILDNIVGISINGTGKVLSDGHNKSAGNTTPGAPNGTIAQM